MTADLRQLKVDAAREALRYVKSDMLLGLGTGSTAEEFVKLLGEEIAGGKLRGVRGVCTSARTEQTARESAVPIIPIKEMVHVDLAIDGADEVDPLLRLIKGRGGALLREKIIEQNADRFVVIADHTKEVERLGVGTLPVVVVPFGAQLLHKRFASLMLDPQTRMVSGAPLITDDGLSIIDLRIPPGLEVGEVVDAISSFAGVVETGYFPTEATDVLIASPQGIRRKSRSGMVNRT